LSYAFWGSSFLSFLPLLTDCERISMTLLLFAELLKHNQNFAAKDLLAANNNRGASEISGLRTGR
jgi:hypothetical protein